MAAISRGFEIEYRKGLLTIDAAYKSCPRNKECSIKIGVRLVKGISHWRLPDMKTKGISVKIISTKSYVALLPGNIDFSPILTIGSSSKCQEYPSRYDVYLVEEFLEHIG